MKNIIFKISILFLIMVIAASKASFSLYAQPPNPSAISFFSEKDFNLFFPQHNQFFSFKSFKQAVAEMSAVKIRIEKRGIWIFKITKTDLVTGKSTVVREDPDWEQGWAKKQPYSSEEINYGDFCANLNKREAAAFFAHIAHETRNGINGKFNDGLMLTHELRTDLEYVIQNKVYPAVAGQKYYGRGPLQLSYNGNYGFASTVIFGNPDILLNKPDLVTKDPVLSFKTAIYFWMTPQNRKPSAHAVMTGEWKPSEAEKALGYAPGFGMTINIINGSLECNKGENNSGMQDRIGFYQHFLKLLKISDPNCVCSCGKMIPFPS
jgi:hypothetical protein